MPEKVEHSHEEPDKGTTSPASNLDEIDTNHMNNMNNAKAEEKNEFSIHVEYLALRVMTLGKKRSCILCGPDCKFP